MTRSSATREYSTSPIQPLATRVHTTLAISPLLVRGWPFTCWHYRGLRLTGACGQLQGLDARNSNNGTVLNWLSQRHYMGTHFPMQAHRSVPDYYHHYSSSGCPTTLPTLLNIFKVFSLSMAKHTKHFQIKTITRMISKYQGWHAVIRLSLNSYHLVQ
jgi:hypothetical protein